MVPRASHPDDKPKNPILPSAPSPEAAHEIGSGLSHFKYLEQHRREFEARLREASSVEPSSHDTLADLVQPYAQAEALSRNILTEHRGDKPSPAEEDRYNFDPLLEIQTMQTIQARELADTDALTGAATKRHLLEEIDTLAKNAQSPHHRKTDVEQNAARPFSIIMFDVDHFKKVNDTHGHLAGDRVLNGIGKIVRGRIRKGIRRGDIFGRYGGEEFTVVSVSSAEGVQKLAEDLRQLIEVEEFYDDGGNPFHVSISLGIAPFEQGMDTKTVLRNADKALYQAKTQGRNRVCYYVPPLPSAGAEGASSPAPLGA